MGYDTYNAFEKNYDGALALEQARLMKEYGLVDAGYNVSCQGVRRSVTRRLNLPGRHSFSTIFTRWRTALKRAR